MALPYENAKAGQAREAEIRKTLRAVGATAVGFMVDDDADTIIAQFRLRGREITVPVRVGAYAEAWLKANKRPVNSRKTDAQRAIEAREKAEAAAWAILADWIKATAAMMQAGFVDADTAFLPHVRLPSGERIADALAAQEDGPLALPAPSPE